MSIILQELFYGKYEIHLLFHFPQVYTDNIKAYCGYCPTADGSWHVGESSISWLLL